MNYQSSYVNVESIKNALNKSQEMFPFWHIVIDNFYLPEVAKNLESEFLKYESPEWFVYQNKLEHKKAQNNWNLFPPLTYRVFHELCSSLFVDWLSDKLDIKLYPDYGLHGGGWHMHGMGGNLNPHLDYSIHPKAGLERKLNIIVYMSENLNESHGGHLGLWSHDSNKNQPDKLIKEVAPKFNRAILFDTTQNSWHGMSRTLNVDEYTFRKSHAVYYLCQPSVDAAERNRALYAPRDNQRDDVDIAQLIAMRANMQTSNKVYKS
jgi:Rps23 Pro-64 3,4-dihydroxylase Tpa1-like proline 4-hydroxylase